MPVLSSRWELMVDDCLLESLDGTRLELNRPVRRNVAFTADAPWEANNCGFYSVVDDKETDVVRWARLAVDATSPARHAGAF